MILAEAVRCVALLLGLSVPEEEPYLHVVSLTALKADYCNANCRGMYIPLRSRFNGGRYTIVLSYDASADTLIHEIAHHVQHWNRVFVPRAGATGAAESEARALESRWRRHCPQLYDPMMALIDTGGTPLPEALLAAAGPGYAGELGAGRLRRDILAYQRHQTGVSSLPSQAPERAESGPAHERGWAVAE